MKKIIFTLLLTALMVGGALAQKTSRNEAAGGPVLPIDSEPAPYGRLDFYGTENFGVLTPGDSSYAMVCEQADINPSLTMNVTFEPVEDQPGVSQVTGGTWTLMVYMRGRYVGAIFGDIEPGGTVVDTLSEDSQIMSRQIEAAFRKTGGMGIYSGTQPETEASGQFKSSTTYDKGETIGSLEGIL